MLAQKIRETAAAPMLQRYKGYGLLVGLALGLLVGVLVSGPHFYEWSVAASLAVICGCAAGGAFIGWVALALAAGSVAGGGGGGGAWGAGRSASDASAGGEAGGGDGD